MNPTWLEQMRAAQRQWQRQSVAQRLRVVGAVRRAVAADPEAMARSIPQRLRGALHRNEAESLVAEVMPLLAACRLLEREAGRLLRGQRYGWQGRPVWLARVRTRVERVPHGVVLVIAPGNYPLLLAGVQVLQALTAGNAVVWKPAPGTEPVAHALAARLSDHGLPPGLLRVLEGDAQVVAELMRVGVDHVVLTGSAKAGMAVLHEAAETLTPATMELSGWDAVFVLPDADRERALEAILFGMRLNGSFTCMAPRRLFLVGMEAAQAEAMESELRARLAELPAVPVSEATREELRGMVEDARRRGAEIALDGSRNDDGNGGVSATLILHAQVSMRAMRGEVFAPVLSVMRVADRAADAHAQTDFRLTAAIFGPETAAQRLAERLRVGHVVVNGLMVPTADPRIAFGGAGRSGFGLTRGREGLLAMTRQRVVQVQRGGSRREFAPMDEAHAGLFAGLFAGLIRGLYAGTLSERWNGLRQMIGSARKLRGNDGTRR